MYNNGFDFWADLLRRHSRDDALQIANDYLDLQIRNTNPEEHAFCCELYRATQTAFTPA